MLIRILRAMFSWRRKKRAFPHVPTISRDSQRYYADNRTRRQL